MIIKIKEILPTPYTLSSRFIQLYRRTPRRAEVFLLDYVTSLDIHYNVGVFLLNYQFSEDGIVSKKHGPGTRAYSEGGKYVGSWKYFLNFYNHL